MSDDPCQYDCIEQNYPMFPYGPGAEALFSKVLPILLSATVVVISWLAGRVIDKMEVSTKLSLHQGKSGTVVQSVKRATSHEKAANFHSSARGMGGQRDGTVHELEALSVGDDEGRLYNEQYGSEHSQEDGDRYDALGDSPGAQGRTVQVPRSPSMYSQFSQSVFSQSAYGPSAYGPSQRRFHGSTYGHSQYENTSSQGSQYPGPVPSHFGASQLSENTSYHASGSAGPGVVQGAGAASYGHGVIPAPYGGGRGGGIAQRLPPPTYNPYAPRPAGINAGIGVGGMPGRSDLVGARRPLATVAATPPVTEGGGPGPGGIIRGSPPPYSQAQLAQAQMEHAQMIQAQMVQAQMAQAQMIQAQASATLMLEEPRAPLGANAQPLPVQDAASADPGATSRPTSGSAPSTGPAVSMNGYPPSASGNASAPAANPGGGSGAGAGTAGPKSGFGSDSGEDDDTPSEVPSAFRP